MLLDRIIEGLTKPVKPQAVPSVRKSPEEIVFTGTLEEVNEFFYEKGWTDGLTIMPSTREKVEEFLKYTDYSPDKEIAILPQANLRASPSSLGESLRDGQEVRLFFPFNKA